MNHAEIETGMSKNTHTHTHTQRDDPVPSRPPCKDYGGLGFMYLNHQRVTDAAAPKYWNYLVR